MLAAEVRVEEEEESSLDCVMVVVSLLELGYWGCWEEVESEVDISGELLCFDRKG